jgi:phage gpG-like protein
MVGVSTVLARLIRDQLSKPGTGRRYRVAKGKKRGRNAREKGWHVASAPGNPPAANRGELRASWTVVANANIGSTKTENEGFASLNRTGSALVLTVGSNKKYAAALEFGSTRARIAARPYIRPVIEKLQGDVEGIIADAVANRMGRP